jgi:hypothetical protein
VESAQWRAAQVECDALLNNIVATAGNINVDDVRHFGGDEPDNRLEAYLSSPGVQAALHLVNPPAAYSSCSAIVGVFFAADEMKPSAHLLPALVDEIDVFIYEGIFGPTIRHAHAR